MSATLNPAVMVAPVTAAEPVAEAAVGRIDPARRMLQLAVGSLIIAGCLALLLVGGRIPGIAEAIGDPLFFKRCLVVHVDLALVVWFAALAGTLFALLPATAREQRIFKFGTIVAVVGVGLMMSGALARGAAPVLSNYVPVIAHPRFVVGIAFFFTGMLGCFLDGRLFGSTPPARHSQMTISPLWVPPEVAAGLKTSALAYLVAMVTLVASWISTPASLDERSYYELVFWGGGHVLQVANVSAMLSVWLWLLASLLGRPVMKPMTAWYLFALLLAPHLIAPVLARSGTLSTDYHHGFTRLMQFGIAPVVLIVLGLCGRALHQAFAEERLTRRAWGDPRLVGFLLSAVMTVGGFALGAVIRSSNTMIPGHYHAAIGAVTMAFMAVTYQLLQPLGFRFELARFPRLVPVQLACFGLGQVIFALGFGWAGLNGAGRKAYASEQHVRSASEYAGLIVMGVGGVIAVVGGLLFLGLVIGAWRSCATPRTKTRPGNCNL